MAFSDSLNQWYRRIKADPYSTVLMLGRLYGMIPRYLPRFRDYALPPLFMVLELTYRCNLSCSFCYQRFPNEIESSRSGSELTHLEIRGLSDQMPSRSCFFFSGGEVLLRKDLPEILKTVSQRHPCHIFTNGTLVTPEIADQWVNLGITSVAISIEGSEIVHDQMRGRGTFLKAARAMRMLAEAKRRKGSRFPLLNLKTTITAENAGMLSDSVTVAEDCGADYCTFQILNNTTCLGAISIRDTFECLRPPPLFVDFPVAVLERELERINELSRKSRVRVRFLPEAPSKLILAHYSNMLDIAKYTCVSPWTVMYISPTGLVYPCLNYYIGNVQEQSLRQLWNNPRYRLFRARLLRNGLFPDCRGCCDLIAKGANISIE
jgi:MoaA/NifB/PqqE/SkfB family radical SAM enzyme